jgi:hypothetical protein
MPLCRKEVPTGREAGQSIVSDEKMKIKVPRFLPIKWFYKTMRLIFNLVINL